MEEYKIYTDIKGLVINGEVDRAIDKMNKLRGTHRPCWFIANAFKNKDEKVGLEVFKRIDPQDISWKKNNALRWAVKNNLLEAVKALEPYWDTTVDKSRTIFNDACTNGNEKIVEILKSKSKKPYKNEFINACMKGHDKVVKILIDDTEEDSIYEGLANSIGRDRGHEKVVEIIYNHCEKRGKTKVQERSWNMNLNIAIGSGQLEVVKIISKMGVNYKNIVWAMVEYEMILRREGNDEDGKVGLNKRKNQEEIIKIITDKMSDVEIEESLNNFNQMGADRYPNGRKLIKSIYQSRVMRREIKINQANPTKRKRII